ncbi:Bud-site selection protein [Pseudovirgaria hyperparasitica]|uniref:Bud-site selection protein n=1 Tax=Pseudovirgaria hyperparasitica TaxID=470096 RepID=A0A6A6VZU4_9PEZI|nr:Bud-site selection protein [Pseudovirgaria hyperparasitica]KAF2755775.1 Bud-site selection protein [Pseudovirgaria hyperparasitica]
MLKRKRSDSLSGDDDAVSFSEESSSSPPPRQSLRTVRAESKLQTGIANVHKALKLAAGLERQKLGRRRKEATEKGDAKLKERLDAEYIACKTLSLRDVAQIHLCKVLNKIKSISANPARPPLLDAPSKTFGSETATLNVAARLYKADPVKKAVSHAIEDLVKSLGPVEDISKKDDRRYTSDTGNGDEEWSGISSSENGSDMQINRHKDLVASDDGERDECFRGIRDKATRPGITKSAFMPTLTMGGYWSGSESEAEDLEEDLAPKKNRRGQRARQQLAEKKFGQQAKHLQKKSKDERNAGWDPKKGAQLTGDDRSRSRGARISNKSKERFRPAVSTGANSAPLKATKLKTRDDTGPVHPSWEAAKKAKEQAQTAQFSGKKITFD